MHLTIFKKYVYACHLFFILTHVLSKLAKLIFFPVNPFFKTETSKGK